MIITTDATSKRRKVTKFALAGVAVFGVTAAATSAAWSDNVFFGAQAEAAKFELEGYNPTSGFWEKADDSGARIVLPANALDKVGPGIADTFPLSVRNNGDLTIFLNSAPTAAVSGDLFDLPNPAEVTFTNFSDVELLPGEQANFDVVVTGNANWVNTDFQTMVGNVVITVVGSSSN